VASHYGITGQHWFGRNEMKAALKDNWPSEVFSLKKKWDEAVYVFLRRRETNTHAYQWYESVCSRFKTRHRAEALKGVEGVAE
jgi:hypothetical protein